MTERKQFFKEEVTPYQELFTKYKKFCSKVSKKEGIVMTEIAEIWRERALVDLQDRMHLLLTSYSH